MNDLTINKVEVTNVTITNVDLDNSIKADVEIEINHYITVKGLHIALGQFGHYIKIPAEISDCFNSSMDESLRTAILSKYAKVLASLPPKEMVK